MTFELDTSGSVRISARYCPIEWSNLSPFEQGYVEAMLLDFGSKRPWRLSDDGYEPGFSDLAPETLAVIRKDCTRFTNALDCPEYVAERVGGEREQGRRFWLSRNRQQPDFNFGPGWPINGPQQGAVDFRAKEFPPRTVTLNDAGKVVFAE